MPRFNPISFSASELIYDQGEKKLFLDEKLLIETEEDYNHFKSVLESFNQHLLHGEEYVMRTRINPVEFGSRYDIEVVYHDPEIFFLVVQADKKLSLSLKFKNLQIYITRIQLKIFLKMLYKFEKDIDMTFLPLVRSDYEIRKYQELNDA